MIVVVFIWLSHWITASILCCWGCQGNELEVEREKGEVEIEREKDEDQLEVERERDDILLVATLIIYLILFIIFIIDISNSISL